MYLLFCGGTVGAVMASFLACMIARKGQPIRLSDRSACDKCKKQLRWFELIPVLSYIFQRGKCNACGERIPPRYFLGEILGILTGISVVWMDIKFGVASVLLFIAALWDMEYQEVPTKLSLGIFLYALIVRMATGFTINAFIGLCAFGVLYTVYQVRDFCIGGADIWALSGCLMFIGVADIPVFLLSISLPALVALIIQRRCKQGEGITLLPFIHLGFFLTYVWALYLAWD